MEPLPALVLVAGGFVAGVVNTLAGAGSLLTVPLLVLVGLPGTVANGTNRVGVLLQNLAAAWSFRREGVSGIRASLPILPPVVAGSFAGAALASRLDDAAFERLFGVLMIALLFPLLRGAPSAGAHARPWPASATRLVAFGIGLYGGAIQAGVGLFLVFALSHAGSDLVRASSVKVIVIGVLTATALPVFVLAGDVAWTPALLLAAGQSTGGFVGARLAVRGGERVIRPVLVLAVLGLAGKMLGLY